MKGILYYQAAVIDLQAALDRVEAVNRNFPQYRIPTTPIKRSLKALKLRLAKLEEKV